MWKPLGSVRFEVEDAGVALLNKLSKFGLRDVHSVKDGVGFSAALVNKREIIRIIGKRTYKCTENKNIFSVLNFFYTRKVLIAAALIFFAAFITLDQFLFKIKIDGVHGTEYTQVSAFLRDNGISRFSPKSTKRANFVAQKIVEEFDFVAAANAYVKGSGVIFSIHRAENISHEVHGDIISTHDGVITRIIVLSGTPLVTVGDVVRKDDILVSGARAMAIIYIHNGPELVCVLNNTNVKLEI